jgi:preprotein translocase subunit YajC
VTPPLLLQAAAPGPGILDSVLFPLGIMLLIFFFLVIRPQQKRQKEHDAMLKSADKGDAIVTSGGLHGKVTGVTDDVLTVEIASLQSGDRIRVKVNRASVQSVTKSGQKADKPDKAASDKSGKPDKAKSGVESKSKGGEKS